MNIAYGTAPHEYIAAAAWRIANELKAGRSVVWLVSMSMHVGDSVAIMELIKTAPLQKLVIAQVDEQQGRAVPLASSWLNAQHLGFKPASARVANILRTGIDQRDVQEIIAAYQHLLSGILQEASVVIMTASLTPTAEVSGVLSLPAVAVEPEVSTQNHPHVPFVTATTNETHIRFGVLLPAVYYATALYINGHDHSGSAAHRLRTHGHSAQLDAISKRVSEVYIYI